MSVKSLNRIDQSFSKLASHIPGSSCSRSSITDPHPIPDLCENCGDPRMKTLDRPLCWICARLLVSVALDIADHDKDDD